MVCNLHSHAPSLRAITDRSAELSLLPAPQLQSVGIHPWHADGADFDAMEALAADPLVAAIGEAGFDRRRGPSPDIQREVFRRQARLASSLGKPLIIHCVKAIDILYDEHRRLRPDVPWIVHGFRGKPLEAATLLKRGIGLSLGPRFNPATAAMIPDEKLFIETDDDADARIETVAALVGAVRSSSPEEIMDLSAANISRICSLGIKALV